MKRNYLLALCFMLGILSVWGQEKIQSSFSGYSFGTSQERLLSALESDSLHPMQMEQGLLLKDAELSNTPFQTLAFMFSPLDGGLYKVVASNRYQSRKEAVAHYDEQLSRMKEKYPRLQKVSNPVAEKMSSWMDGDNAVYIGLFPGKDGKTYFVNVNYWNILMQQNIQSDATR